MRLGLSHAKGAIRSLIARHRRSRPMMAMHRLAGFYEAAWRNEGADFAVNGEKSVLERLRPAGFRQAVDVGANIGSWTRAALEIWPTCSVDALEVAPETFARLEAALAPLGAGSRARCHQLGLSDRAGLQTMYYFPGHSELTSDTRRHEQHSATAFEARMTTLDAFCGEHDIRSIDYLKIDVEGAEHRVLKGAAETLHNRRVSVVQFEYGAFSIGTRFLLEDFYALLGAQFHIGKIYPNYVDFADYDWQAEDFRFANFVAVARERPDLRQLLAG